MADDQVEPLDEERLESYVERMVALQKKISDSQKELSLITQDAKINGFNLEALNFLVKLRTKHTTDLGHRVLISLVKYAHLSGTPLDVVIERQSLNPGTTTSLLPDDESELEEEKPKSTTRIFATAALGCILAVSLLWLLT